MESAKSVSSRDSLYSVESATSEEEEEERCGDLEVFLSDSGSDAEKEAAPFRRRQGAYPGGQDLLFSPEAGRTNSGLRCRDRKRHIRKPLGMLAASKLRPGGPNRPYPGPLEGAYCARLDADGKAASQTRVENGGRKRLSSAVGGSQTHKTTAPPSLQGIKRQRKRSMESREDPHFPCWTARDHLFAQKCWELQGFVRPLMGLLNRLKMGRFDRGLSSFQQSVAMDRIQRIIGVLQKPEMGERYLGTLLQVERMLKVWFPHVALKDLCPSCSSVAEEESKAPKEPSEEKVVQGRRAASGRELTQSPPTEELHQTHLTDPAAPDDDKAGAPQGRPASGLQPNWPAVNLTWIHTSPISNPPLGHADLGLVNSAFGQALLGPPAGAYGVVLFLPSNPAAPVAFDRATSATPVHASPTCCHPKSPLPGSGELPRCQSLPGAPLADRSLATGPLACHSGSLPLLPTSSPRGRRGTDGRPAPSCQS